MRKASQRRAAKRVRSAPGKPAPRKPARGAAQGADFCALAQAALKRGEQDAISDKQLQRVLFRLLIKSSATATCSNVCKSMKT